MTVAITPQEAIAVIDKEIEDGPAPYDVKDAFRIVRGWMRKKIRKSSTNLQVVVVESEGDEPITARHSFARATEIAREALDRSGSEPPKE